MGTEPASIRAMSHIEEMIKEGKVRIGLNKLGQDSIHWTFLDGVTSDLVIGSNKFRDILSHRIWADLRVLLNTWELKRIIEILKGMVANSSGVFVDLDQELDFLEENPFVSLVVDFVEAKGSYESTASALLRILQKYAHEHQHPCLNRRQFPGGPNVLSRRLAQLRPNLRAFNVEVNFRRSNGCIITLKYQRDDRNGQPASQPSTEKPANQEGSGKDDKWAELEALKHRRDSWS